MSDAGPRYERKMRVAGFELQFVDDLIRSHPAHFREAYRPRRVNSLYLDTVRLSHYEMHLAGITPRRKVRFRWYGESDRAEQQLEIKSRHGAVGKKNVYRIGSAAIDGLLAGSRRQHVLQSGNLPTAVHELVGALHPTLVNRYRRRYFESTDGKIRLTVDNDMRFYRVQGLRGRLSEEHFDHTVVVEVKYLTENANAGHNVTNWFPFPLGKSSKYVTGVEMLGSGCV